MNIERVTHLLRLRLFIVGFLACDAIGNDLIRLVKPHIRNCGIA